MKLLVMRIRHDADGCGLPEYVAECRSIKAVKALALESDPDEYGNDWTYIAYHIKRGVCVEEVIFDASTGFMPQNSDGS